MTRKEIFMSVTKWVLYSLVLALSYTIQVTMKFTVWQPYLTLTVAVAVSFFENELSGVVFAAFAGMMHDLAMGSLFGFTSIWLMPCCLFVTLFAVNLIHRNIQFVCKFFRRRSAFVFLFEFREGFSIICLIQ